MEEDLEIGLWAYKMQEVHTRFRFAFIDTCHARQHDLNLIEDRAQCDWVCLGEQTRVEIIAACESGNA
jgi:hypothetical protein